VDAMGSPVGTKVWNRLASGAAEPFAVSVLTTIVSPPLVVSPFTGVRAGFVFVELLERTSRSNDPAEEDEKGRDHYDLLTTVVLGDVATLRDEDGDEITIVARRARIEPALPRHGGATITHMPPEIVPLLRKATGRGVLCYRELTLSTGDKLRLRAVVEPTTSVVAYGHRSGTRVTYVARDDLAPVVLEEVFEAPGC
jgi:hypothetical protein